jgi:HEAT repeat protein
MQVDLLRALGPQIGTVTGAAAAFAATATDRSFRTRYLLQQPAAELAKREDRNAVRYLAESMRHDESPHVRARAAQVAVGIAALAEDLAMALSDSEPRVREATLTSLAGDTKPSLSAAVTQRIDASLGSDRWTFVRIAAAQALASQTISPDSETALIRALEDESIAVRRAALTALGKSRTARAGERVHEVADDADAPVEVRTAAIASLGQMCRKPSVPLLYKLALRAGTPELPYDRPLGMAALAALGEIHPADVAEKLLPLIRERRVPQQIRSIARGVVEQPGRCAK